MEGANSASWQQRHLIETGAWAAVTGNYSPNSAVAKACAQQLVKIRIYPAQHRRKVEPKRPGTPGALSLS